MGDLTSNGHPMNIPTIQKWPKICYKYVRPLNRILKFPLIIFDLKLCHEINQLMGKISWEICDSFGSILGQRPNHKWFLKSSTSFARAGKSSDVDHADIWWVNYNTSLTWIKAIWGSFPLLTMIIVRSQWGRYNLPRYPPTPADARGSALGNNTFDSCFGLQN